MCVYVKQQILQLLQLPWNRIRFDAHEPKKKNYQKVNLHGAGASSGGGDSISVANTFNTILVVTYDKQPHTINHTNDRLYHHNEAGWFDFRFLFTTHTHTHIHKHKQSVVESMRTPCNAIEQIQRKRLILYAYW